MMTWNRKANVCYDFDTDTHSKCKAMSSVSLVVEKENRSESRFKKIVESLVSDSHSHVKYDECTFWFQNLQDWSRMTLDYWLEIITTWFYQHQQN